MHLLKFVCTSYTSMKHDPVLSTNELLNIKLKAKTVEHTHTHTFHRFSAPKRKTTTPPAHCPSPGPPCSIPKFPDNDFQGERLGLGLWLSEGKSL